LQYNCLRSHFNELRAAVLKLPPMSKQTRGGANNFRFESFKRTNSSRRSLKCLLYECCNAIKQTKSDGKKETEPGRKTDKEKHKNRKRNCDMPYTNGPQVGRPLDSSGSLDCGLSCQSLGGKGCGHRCVCAVCQVTGATDGSLCLSNMVTVLYI